MTSTCTLRPGTQALCRDSAAFAPSLSCVPAGTLELCSYELCDLAEDLPHSPCSFPSRACAELKSHPLADLLAEALDCCELPSAPQQSAPRAVQKIVTHQVDNEEATSAGVGFLQAVASSLCSSHARCCKATPASHSCVVVCADTPSCLQEVRASLPRACRARTCCRTRWRHCSCGRPQPG